MAKRKRPDKYELNIRAALRAKMPVTGRWSDVDSNPLFGVLSPSGHYDTRDCGCLTQCARFLRDSDYPISLPAFPPGTPQEVCDDFCRDLAADKRIPSIPDMLRKTRRCLSAFAEWQRRYCTIVRKYSRKTKARVAAGRNQ